MARRIARCANKGECDVALLRVEGLNHRFGGLHAVRNYNLTIEPGEVAALIGPNGAGKTTIFNLITGVYRPTEGKIELDGQNIVGLQPYEIAARGLGRTFQNLKLWRHMTVLEHVKMARYSRLSYGLLGAFFGTPQRHREEAESERIALELLELVEIRHLAHQLVVNLPYGAMRRVEMARALATEPRVLLLDEPTVGMTPEELKRITEIIRKIHAELNLAIFLIEHRMEFVMALSDRIQTLVFGEVIAEGAPEEIRNNPAVIDAYLGREAVH
jgi:branched-chain amino acid transport system ATP-binding protein